MYVCKNRRSGFVLKYLYFVFNAVIALTLLINSSHLIFVFSGVLITNEFYALLILAFSMLYLLSTNKILSLVLMTPFLLHLTNLINVSLINDNIHNTILLAGLYGLSIITTILIEE